MLKYFCQILMTYYQVIEKKLHRKHIRKLTSRLICRRFYYLNVTAILQHKTILLVLVRILW